jgi:hypothetical protein
VRRSKFFPSLNASEIIAPSPPNLPGQRLDMADSRDEKTAAWSDEIEIVLDI